MNNYAARVPDYEQRVEAARLYTRWKEAERIADDIESGDVSLITPEKRRQLDALEDQQHVERRALAEAHQTARRALIGGGDEGLADARAAALRAEEAYNAHTTPPVHGDWDGTVYTCALSGAPLYEDDVTAEIEDKTILASLFLPSDAIDALLGDEEEEAEVEIIEEAA